MKEILSGKLFIQSKRKVQSVREILPLSYQVLTGPP